MNNEYLRGDIIWIDFGVGIDSEQGGIRPALIVQNNMGNKFSPCLIVLPITSSATKHKIPTQEAIMINGRFSLVLGEQIRTVAKKRIVKDIIDVIDHISDMTCINKALMISLGLAL